MIMAVMNFDYKTKKRYTGLKIQENQWDKRKYRVKNCKEASEMNSVLIKWEERYNNYVKSCEVNKKPLDLEEAYHLLDKEKSPHYGRRLLTDAFMYYLDRYQTKLSPGTKGKYTAVLDDIIRYNPEVNIDMVCGDFYGKFAEFLIKNGNQNSTINRKITTIRTCMGAVAREGWIDSLRYMQDYDLDEMGANRVPLNKDERVALMEYRSENMAHQHVVNAFIFACYTGLRFSDVKKLDGNNIVTYMINGEAVKCVTTFMSKTKGDIRVPIPKHIHYLLRPGQIFPLPANATVNEILKIVAKELGFTRKVECTRCVGSKVKVEHKPLHDILSFHFARYTYTNLLDESGMNSFMMKDALGHSSVQITEGYRRADEMLRIEETLKKVGI